jgi:hypothetical protein
MVNDNFMYKKKIKIILIAFVFSLVVIIPVSYSAGANSQPVGVAGSREDPIVTVSYVSSYVEAALNRAMQNIDIGDIGSAPAPRVYSMDDADNNNNNHSSFELVMLMQNQTIRATSGVGTLELIVRQGSQAAVTSQHHNLGLADLTSAEEHLNGDIVPVNHLLLIPRADGRGLLVLSETAFILVRGDYEIE